MATDNKLPLVKDNYSDAAYAAGASLSQVYDLLAKYYADAGTTIKCITPAAAPTQQVPASGLPLQLNSKTLGCLLR